MTGTRGDGGTSGENSLSAWALRSWFTSSIPRTDSQRFAYLDSEPRVGDRYTGDGVSNLSTTHGSMKAPTNVTAQSAPTAAATTLRIVSIFSSPQKRAILMHDFVVDRFERSAQAHPRAPAILCEDGQRIAYEDLNSVANDTARILVALLSLDAVFEFGETPMVGLLMDRTIAIIAMMLGIHKAGCAYVPVDPAFPPDRQQYIMEHSRCNVLIVDSECYEAARSAELEIPARHILLSDHNGRIVAHYGPDGEEMSSIRSASLESMRHVRSVFHTPQALAYVLYTSGSTGKPKGVAVKQVGVANIIRYFADELRADPTCKVMCLTTFCFDISVLETFVPLTRGAAIVLATGATRKDPFRIIELMQEHGVNIFQATPTTYEMMLATGWQGDAGVQFLVGGEAFRPTLLPLARRCAALLNVYGPTETTIWSTCFRIQPDFEEYAQRMQISGVPIGEAISETQLYLVGESAPWREVKTGEEGELFIGGIGVAAGYLHAPHLTADKFIPNPFDGTGMVYRTGDVVRQLGDGNYLFVRRLDDQVKIDGFRIELEEIEKVFMQAAEVDQAVALVRENKLVLYLRPLSTVLVTVKRMPSIEDATMLEEVLFIDEAVLEKVREHAARQLTYYMMPKHFVIVRDFAKTPNGKLDKKALVSPRELRQLPLQPTSGVAIAGVGAAAMGADLKGSSAGTSREREPRPLSAIICDVVGQLRGKRPQPSSSLGAFGLDSLGSVMLLRQLGTALRGEIRLHMQDLFTPGITIRDLGRTLYAKASDEARRALQLLPEPNGEDMEAASGSGAGVDEGDEVLMDRPDYFGASLLANKRLFEGLRGVFTFMVLWNHWHRSDQPFNRAFDVDTKLFFLISGYTTASQMRVPPEVTRTRRGAGDDMVLAPKGPFPLGKFWLVRAVGLYPILWLALALYAPIYAGQARYQYPDHVPGLGMEARSLECLLLYVVGLNVLEGACTARGPHILYASSLIINFLVYGVACAALSWALSWASTEWIDSHAWCRKTEGFTTAVPLRDPRQSWRAYAGKVALYLNFSLFHPEVFAMTLLVVTLVALALMLLITRYHPKVFTDIWYFFIAAWVLSLSEMWCGQRIAELRKGAAKKGGAIVEDLSSPSAYAGALVRLVRARLGWTHLRSALSQRWYAPLSTSPPEHSIVPGGAGAAAAATTVIGAGARGFFALEGDSGAERVRLLLWRFAPDALVMGMAVQLSCAGDLCAPTPHMRALSQYSMYLLVPAAFLVFVAISVHQRGLARHNFTRLLLESRALNLLGYASYPVYLLQNAFLQFYFTFLFQVEGYEYYPRDPDRRYFRALPLGYRAAGVILVIAIGWLVQRYLQDNLVVKAFSRALAKAY